MIKLFKEVKALLLKICKLIKEKSDIKNFRRTFLMILKKSKKIL